MYESSPTETNQKKDEKEQIMKKIRQLENQQKILLNRQSDMERRARTRRLIEHGAILESVFPTLAALPGRGSQGISFSATVCQKQRNF